MCAFNIVLPWRAHSWYLSPCLESWLRALYLHPAGPEVRAW